MLNNRCIKILDILNRVQDYVSCAKLAAQLHVSTRTIRNDLIKIEDFFIEHHLPAFDRNHTNGIRIMNTVELQALLQTLQMDTRKYIYKKEEIQTFMLLKLLYEPEAIPSKYFEDVFQVSRSTIFNIINDVTSYLYDKRIQLVKTAKVGTSLHAHAIYKIQEFANQILNRCDLAQFYDFIESAKADGDNPTKSFLTLILDQNVSFYLKNYIVKIETELHKTFDDASFIKVLIFLEKMISNKLEYGQGNLQEDLNSLQVTKEYQVAKQVIEDLQTQFAFKNDTYIQASLTLFLLTSKSDDGKGEGPFLDLSYRLMRSVERQLNVEILNPENLVHFLALHMQPMIYRYKTNIHLENPLFLQIIHDYKDIYEAVRQHVNMIEQECNIQVSDHEVSFIAIHFASNMQKEQSKDVHKKRVVVVCVEGIAISHKIAFAIEQHFDVEVTKILALRNLNDEIIDANDYIIANIDLPIHTRKFIKITSEMNSQDIKLLEQAFHQQHQEDHNLAKVENLMNAIKKWCTIKDLEGLQVEILQVMKETKVLSNKISKLPMNFEKDCVSVQATCNTWQEAITLSCAPLLQKGWITSSYEAKIISNIREFGGYMVVAPRIMLAHAGSEDGVLHNCMSVVNLKHGFELPNQYHLPIQMVISMGVTDEKSHLNFLNELMELINDQASVQKMISMDCAAEVYRFWKNNVQF